MLASIFSPKTSRLFNLGSPPSFWETNLAVLSSCIKCSSLYWQFDQSYPGGALQNWISPIWSAWMSVSWDLFLKYLRKEASSPVPAVRVENSRRRRYLPGCSRWSFLYISDLKIRRGHLTVKRKSSRNLSLNERYREPVLWFLRTSNLLVHGWCNSSKFLLKYSLTGHEYLKCPIKLTDLPLLISIAYWYKETWFAPTKFFTYLSTTFVPV